MQHLVFYPAAAVRQRIEKLMCDGSVDDSVCSSCIAALQRTGAHHLRQTTAKVIISSVWLVQPACGIERQVVCVAE